MKSRCTLYKSWSEELSVFGWPLQTSGLLASEFSSQSFTILSGRVTQVKITMHFQKIRHMYMCVYAFHLLTYLTSLHIIYSGPIVKSGIPFEEQTVHGHKENGVPLSFIWIEILGFLSTKGAP